MKKILIFLLLISSFAFGQSTTQPQRLLYGTRTEVISYPGLAGVFWIPNFATRRLEAFIKDANDSTSPESDTVIVANGGVRFKRLTILPVAGGSGGVSSYLDLTDVPATFAPSAHTQAISTVIGLQDSLSAKQAVLTLGSVLQYRRGDNSLATLNSTSVGLGNVANVDTRIATNLTSGTIPAGRFGSLTIPVSAMNSSGTPSISTYLRGDGVWATPPSSAVTTVAGRTGAITLSNTDISGLGTASTFNVPASGNAGTGEVVKGNDTRLTGLTANLGAKSDTSHRHSALHLTSGFIPAARYETGTIPVLSLSATGSTADTAVLRRNGTWAVISGGGGSSGLSDPGSNGILSRTASGTTTSRTFSTSGDGISVSNGTGVSGNPTYSLANDAASIEALTGTGIPKRTGTDTWSLGAVDLSGAEATGTMAAARMPALTGDIITTAGAVASTYNGVVPASKGGAGTITGLMKANGSGTVSAATAGTDYVVPSGNITGTSANVTGTIAIANGGTGTTTAAGARTNLGATTLGANLFTLANPSTISFPRVNADNTVSLLDASGFRTAIGAGSSSATVGSVALSLPSIFSVSGSPVTTTGTLAATLASQTANYIFAAPTGSAGSPTFRALLNADMPSSIDATKIGGGAVSSTEFSYIDGVTSAIQPQIDAKITYKTIAEVRAFSAGQVTANPRVWITDAGKEGEFKYVAGSSNSDNTGMVLVTTTGSYRFERVVRGGIYPEWFGAVGDNSTIDLTALNSALTVAAALNKVLILDGTYAINDDFVISVPVSITGSGTIRQTTLNKNVIKIQNTTNVTITNLKIEGNNSATVATFTSNNGISAINVKGLRLEGLEVYKCNSNGLMLQNVKNYYVIGNHFRENKYVYDTGSDIIAYSYESNSYKGQYGVIKENRCYSTNSQGISLVGDAEYDIEISSNSIVCHIDGVEATGSFFDGAGKRRHGINYSYAGANAGRYKITNNTIRKTSSTGIYGHGGGGLNRSVIITGNEIDSVGLNAWDSSLQGGMLFVGMGIGDIISDNRVSNVPSRAGIAITESYSNPTQKSTFTNNTVRNCVRGFEISGYSTNVSLINCNAFNSTNASYFIDFYLINQNHNIELINCYGKGASNGTAENSALAIDTGLGDTTLIKIKNCRFEGGGKTAGGYGIDILSAKQKSVIIEDCVIRNFSRGINYTLTITGRWKSAMAKNVIFENCTRAAYYYADNSTTTGVFEACRFNNCDVDSNSGTEIWMNGSGWKSVHKGLHFGDNIEIQDTAVPTTGNFLVSDRVWRTPAASGQASGWICTATTPTFKIISTLP